jgi:GT2 family glycosyltransferase
VNQGIEVSGTANVLVLNNDCFVGPNCLETLALELTTQEKVAAIGPLTGDRGGQSLMIENRRRVAEVGPTILDALDDPVETAARLLQRRKTREREVLAFFCTLLNREALERFGVLDLRFESGLAADDEWCVRVREQGWRTLLACGAYAAHMHQSTFTSLQIDRDALQQESKQVLYRVLTEDTEQTP